MITSKLTEFILSTDYDQIPGNVIKQAKLCFTDFLGVALRGSETKSGAAIREVINEGIQSTVIGHGKTSALEASMANGIFAHALDLDDGHRHAQVHPGACVIPAALSLCEFHKISGKEFISSLVVGYQVAITLGMMVNPDHRRRGFHSTGTCGTFGAAAAACKALNLDRDQTINALGLAGTQAAGLLETDHSGSMGKHLHAGKAAQSGVLSALLAQKGFTGAENILEGDEGFLNAMTDIDTQKVVKFEMDKFRILEIYFKIYPVCRHLHSSIDALLSIINEEDQDLDIDEIQDITVKTYKIAAEHDDYHPHTIEGLKQSLPSSLAIAVLKNDLRLDDLHFQDKEKLEKMSKKIYIEHVEDFDAYYPDKRPATVTINTKSRLYEKRIDLAYGEPENSLNKSDIVKKFHDLNPNMEMEVLTSIDELESYKMNDFMMAYYNS